MKDLRDFKKQDILIEIEALHFPEIEAILFDDCLKLFPQGELKVTGVQNQLPEVKQFCRRVYAETGILLNCTLHLLPPLDSNDLNYRTHFQHRFVYQISGSSKWHFPLIDGIPYRESSNRAKLVSKLKLNDGQVLEKVLDSANALFIPYALSCTVSAETNTPCLFLTFAEEEINVRDILNFLMEDFFGIKDFEARFFEAFDQSEFLQQTQSPNVEASTIKVDDFYTKTKMAKFKHPQGK